jgi:hypothetical protein
MKILSFQPGSLYQNGGAARLLRRLYAGKESEVQLIGIVTTVSPMHLGAISEKIIPAFPVQRKWMRWHLRSWTTYLRENIFKFWTLMKIRKAATGVDCHVIHLVSHGPFVKAFDNQLLLAGKKLWVSFHDHFSTNGCTFSETAKLWNQADRRLVISEELGIEYQKIFGKNKFEVITDGISKDEISCPTAIVSKAVISIYFAGLLHIDYYPLFETLANTLDLLSKQNLSFKLILRGTQNIGFLNNRSFEVDYRKGFIGDKEIKRELDTAAILYLPIKFTLPDFYLYSLSTKMVGYLGASGSILFHGPGNSAACGLLSRSNAAVCCTSLEVQELASAFGHLIAAGNKVSANAKLLAKIHFDMQRIQNSFWQDDLTIAL